MADSFFKNYFTTLAQTNPLWASRASRMAMLLEQDEREQEAYDARKIVEMPALELAGRTFLKSAADYGPGVAAMIPGPHQPYALGVSLTDLLFGRPLGAMTRTAMGEPREPAPGMGDMLKQGLLMGALAYPHPYTRALGAAAGAYGLGTRYGATQQELESIGGATDPLSTIAQMTLAPGVPGVTSGGSPFGVAGDVLGITQNIGAIPAVTQAARRFIGEPRTARLKAALPTVLGERFNVLEPTLRGTAGDQPIDEVPPAMRDVGALGMATGGKVTLWEGLIDELWSRRVPFPVRDPSGNVVAMVDPNTYKNKAVFRNAVQQHEAAHLAGITNERLAQSLGVLRAKTGQEPITTGQVSAIRNILRPPPIRPAEAPPDLFAKMQQGARPIAPQSDVPLANIFARPQYPPETQPEPPPSPVRQQPAFPRRLARVRVPTQEQIVGREIAKEIATQRAAGTPEYNRAMSIYQHIKAGEGGQSDFRQYPKWLRERVKSDYEQARGAGKGPFFMATKAKEAEDSGLFESMVRSVKQGFGTLTDSTYRNAMSALEEIRRRMPDLSWGTGKRKGQEAIRKNVSEVISEGEQSMGESLRLRSENIRINEDTGFSRAKQIIDTETRNPNSPLSTQGAQMWADSYTMPPDALARKYGVSRETAQAVDSLKQWSEQHRTLYADTRMFGRVKREQQYFKQVPKELGVELPKDIETRKMLADTVIDPARAPVLVPKQHAGLVEQLQKIRADMTREIYDRLYNKLVKTAKDPEKARDRATRITQEYTDEYMKGQIYRETPALDTKTLIKAEAGFLKARGIPGLGGYQEQNLSRLTDILSAEYAKAADMPRARWIMDNIFRVEGKGTAPLAGDIIKKLGAELSDYYSGASISRYEPEGMMAQLANKWFGTRYKSISDAGQGLVSFFTKNLIATPKFLTMMNPYDLFVRAAASAEDWREMGTAFDIFNRYVFKRSKALRDIAKPLIREGNILQSQGEWMAGDKGTLPEFLQRVVGQKGYEIIGKIYNTLPKAVERQEISNNRMIFLWNLERQLRKNPAVPKSGYGSQLILERLSDLPKDFTQKAIRSALAQTFEQQGRLGGLFGLSATGAELKRGAAYGKNSAHALAFMFGRMFTNYPISTVNNTLRTMVRILDSGDADKIRAIQPIALVAATSLGTMGVPQYVANVQAGRKDPALDAFIVGLTREFRLPTTTFAGRLAEDVGRTGVAALRGELPAVRHGLGNILRPIVPGATIYQQMKFLFGEKGKRK